MKPIEYVCVWRDGRDYDKVLATASVFVPAVLIQGPIPEDCDPLPSDVARPFIDAFLKCENRQAAAPGEYVATIEKWPHARQPWPIFVSGEYGEGGWVAEFYPKNFESQTIETAKTL